MAHEHHAQNSGIGGFLRSRTGLVLITAFYLFTEHTAHTIRYLPFGLLLCPFLHLFMHRGHGGHGGQGNQEDHSGHQINRPEGPR